MDLYPGVDLELTGEGGRIVPRLVCRANCQFALRDVRLKVEGADAVELAWGEGLLLTTAVGQFTLPLFQAVAAEGTPLDLAEARPLVAGGEVAAPFSPAPPLPLAASSQDNPNDLLYATFLGGGGYDGGSAIAVDAAGAAYVTGVTRSTDFPTTPGAFDTSHDGNLDVFVTKLNAAGSGLAYATFLGGSDWDVGSGIAVDAAGAAYVTGSTWSPDFPTTPGAFDTSYNGGYSDVFVTKLNADGSDLVYSTFLGGSEGRGIAVDAAGAAYVTGWTGSTTFPTTPGAFDPSYNGGTDDFVTKLNAAGSGLVYSTFLGGLSSDVGKGIAVDAAGAAYVTGETYSDDFPTTPGAFDPTPNDGCDAFVAKLNFSGSSLAYATFLGGSYANWWGGSSTDVGYAIAVDGSGAAYVTGFTGSRDFPTTPGVFDPTWNGGWDGFVVKLSPSGSFLAYATFLGGMDYDYGNGIAVDAAGAAYVTGYTASTDFPTTSGAFDSTYNYLDAFVVRLNASGSGLEYATFLGGYQKDSGRGIAVDGSGAAYVTGVTESHDFPTTPGAFDVTINDGYLGPTDAFVTKLALGGGGGPGLSYTGPSYLPADGFVVDEVDGRVTVGDHVHLRLPFRNDSSQDITNAGVQTCGSPQIGSHIGVSIYNGTSWLNCGQTVMLTPSTLAPGQTGVADFWIYVTNNDPIDRNSIAGDTWLRVTTTSGQWTIRISLSPIAFKISGNDELKAGSCLHHPNNFEIQKYAQYAAGAAWMGTPPTNNEDPDTPEQAIRNLVNRVNSEFHYRDRWDTRQPDTVLLSNRHEDIGVCRDYADLTTGLLRALGIPSRYTDGIFIKSVPVWFDQPVGHAWAEAYVGTGSWRQADSTWGTAFEENVYEASGYRVKEVWADRHPLSSASIWSNRQYQCIPPCYASPPDCPTCFRESNQFRFTLQPDLSCVEDVTARYHQTGGYRLALTSVEGLVVRLQAPTLVTRTVPFTLGVGIVNSTPQSLGIITATVAISEYVDSKVPLFQIHPPYQSVSSLGPGEEITVTWTVTPLLTGNGLPLRVMAESGDYLDIAEQPLVVKEPDALPPLTLDGLCGPGTVWPGRPIDITAYVLDENLHPLADASTAVTATVYATPTLGYSTTLSLLPDADGFFKHTLNLPENAPTGTYEVDFTATRPGYALARGASAFYVAPLLTMTLAVTPTMLTRMDVLTITAQLHEQGTAVKGASVWAEIRAPNGQVIVPLMEEDGTYVASFRPADLALNLGGMIEEGTWWITVMTDYYGGNAGALTSITVLYRFYLPLVLRR